MVDFYLIQKVLVIVKACTATNCTLCTMSNDKEVRSVCKDNYHLDGDSKCVADSEDSKTQNCFMLDVNKKCDSCDYGYYFKKDVCTRNSDIDFLSYESTKIIALVISGFFFLFFN